MTRQRPDARTGTSNLRRLLMLGATVWMTATSMHPTGVPAAAQDLEQAPSQVSQTVTIEVAGVPRSITLAGSVTFTFLFDEEPVDARRTGSPTIAYENPSGLGPAVILVEPLGADGQPMAGINGAWPFGSTLIVGIRPAALGAGNGERLSFGNFLPFGESAETTTARGALITAIPDGRVVGPIALIYQLDGVSPGGGDRGDDRVPLLHRGRLTLAPTSAARVALPPTGRSIRRDARAVPHGSTPELLMYPEDTIGLRRKQAPSRPDFRTVWSRCWTLDDRGDTAGRSSS